MAHHGIMGMRWSGFSCLVGSIAFFAYLGKGIAFGEGSQLEPKYIVPADFAYMAKETSQPGIVPEHYIKKEKK